MPPSFKITSPRGKPISSGSGSAVISGTDGVTSRTPVAGDPTREVIHGAYAEGTYIVTGPRREPSPPKKIEAAVAEKIAEDQERDVEEVTVAVAVAVEESPQVSYASEEEEEDPAVVRFSLIEL